MSHASVSLRFERLLDRIQPTDVQVAAAQRHAQQITTRLRGDFDVSDVDWIGSHAKGTAVRGVSDLDLFAVLSRDEIRKWNPTGGSDGILRRVRSSLAVRYPLSAIRRDEQAVTVRFLGGNASVDVVPAQFGRFSAHHPEFLIPDGEGGWLVTSPSAQRAALRNADRGAGGKATGLVQLLKWWAASRPATSALRSLYLEYAVTTIVPPVGWSYSECLAQVFIELARIDCGAVEDPSGVADRSLSCARTPLQRASVKAAVERAAERAHRAIQYEDRGNWLSAIAVWNTTFNGRFPA